MQVPGCNQLQRPQQFHANSLARYNKLRATATTPSREPTLACKSQASSL